MQSIYEYMKRKLHEKDVKVDDIIKRSGVSRTTIYRMMKGIIKPTPEIYKLFVEMLSLDEREERELDYYVRLIDVDEGMLLARKELHKLVFKAPPTGKPEYEDIEFIVYDKERYLKKYSEILYPIAAISQNPSFSIDIKIFNCIEEAYLDPVVKLLDTEEALAEAKIEQLVSLSEGNSCRNIRTLKAMVPLITRNNYTVLFANEDNISGKRTFFEDLMLFRYSYTDNNTKLEKYLVLSFEKGGLSGCYVSDDKSLYEFFEKKYKLLMEMHTNSLIRQSGIELYSDAIFEFETGGKSYLLKPNICYHRIPISVCRDVLGRMNEDQISMMLTYLREGPDLYVNFGDMLESTLADLHDRDEISYKYKKIDVYTKAGLEAFAREGRLSDHYAFLPEFKKEEIKSILENIRSKRKDPQDKFEFYITNQNIHDNVIFCVSERNGIMLEYFDSLLIQNHISSCIIKQAPLTEMFIDFIENYIPENLAISDADADKFIDYLIETYCV